MKIFFIIVGVILILMLLFGRRAWDTMNEEQKHEVNNLYSGGLYSKEEMSEKRRNS